MLGDAKGKEKVTKITRLTYLYSLRVRDDDNDIFATLFCLISVGYHTYVTWVENDTLRKMLWQCLHPNGNPH